MVKYGGQDGVANKRHIRNLTGRHWSSKSGYDGHKSRQDRHGKELNELKAARNKEQLGHEQQQRQCKPLEISFA